MKHLLQLSVATAALGVFPVCLAQAPVADSPQVDSRVAAMLAKLTLEQKLELIGGVDSMFIRAEPEIGLPKLKMSDGPLGVRTWGPSTAYAAGVALAASWDPALAMKIGASLGRDARARGVNFLLGPGVNIYRAPMNGRNFEYFGEDPYLAARTAVNYIEGVQSAGVSATVKHYAANNSEYDRHNLNAEVDERTLRELYLPAFEAAVKEAKVGAVMDSYNLINGEHATQNRTLNIDILRKDWGFDGVLMSDWDATYDGVAAANGGLDLEMPSGKFMNPKTLMPAIRAGGVTEATIDDKVRRILRTAIRFGFLDRDQLDPADPLYSQLSNEVALESARASLTLLKNEGSLLPLSVEKTHTLAIIGPDAYPAVVGGGGSSDTTAFAPSSFLTGISNYLGSRAKVVYVRGLPTPDEIFDETSFADKSGAPTLKLEVFDNPDFSGAGATSTAKNIAHWQHSQWTPTAERPKSMRWTGSYLPQRSGSYLFLIAAGGEDTYTVTIDGKQLLQQTKHDGQAPQSKEMTLTAGTPVTVQVDYVPSSSDLRIDFGIHSDADLVSPEAKTLAASADAVLVSVGFRGSTESEGFDRTFELPYGQNALIDAMATANKNTIVTITAGGGVEMTPWLAQVPAVLHNWYPGQAGGQAMAEVLFGDRAPEGHLPISIERSWSDNPVHDHYYPETRRQGQTPTVNYAEGLMVGYRYYTSVGDKESKTPLFPFGYGLSYTTFSFGKLEVSPKQAAADGQVTVSFDVTDIGQRAGSDVAQLYVGDPSAKIKRPRMELKGFKKVTLAAGETKHVTLTLDRRSFAYWDVKSHGWQVDPGRFIAYVGDSSEHLPLTTEFSVGK